jgi:hypothetical protein
MKISKTSAVPDVSKNAALRSKQNYEIT